ncbi:MAG: hypothetical protein IPK82_05090 [Polyangiaceae bacterium]|nr:hypothetical protein [Polyangiaceae bacterium]
MPARCPRNTASCFAATVACVCALGTLNTADAAEPLPMVVLRAPGAEDCVDASTLADRVMLLTGRRALKAAEGSATQGAFEVQILHSADGYTAIVLASGKSRQISDPGPSCENLSDALALTLAILVDSDEPDPITPPSGTATPSPPVRIYVPPPIDQAQSVGPRLLISPSFGLSSGLSGAIVPTLILVNDLRLIGPFSVLAGFTWMPAQDFPLGDGRLELQLMYGQIAGCASTWSFLGSARLGGCAQFNAGALRAKAIGYSGGTEEVVRPYTSFGLTGLLDIPVVGPLYWSTRLSVFLNVPQEAFAIRDVGTAFDPPLVGFVVGTGASVKIF